MASEAELTLRDKLQSEGIRFLWQGDKSDIRKLSCEPLYRVAEWATPDFYLPGPNLFVEVKGQMTVHQITKMLFLCTQCRYYTYQHTEEDWDPTIGALVEVTRKPPDSAQKRLRREYNRELQIRELCHVACTPGLADKVSGITKDRLRAYVDFFDRRLREATGAGLCD